MMQLCKDLRLPVNYKVNEVVEAESAGGQGQRQFLVVVHVCSDHAFKKYLETCSATDMLLYRGLLLKVTTNQDASRVLGARVQQAFLPKFENEGQDASVADAIVAQAEQRYMVVTIKHSGSLVTLSGEGFAAKNSLANDFTAGAALLLRAHFDRVHGAGAGAARLASFMALLRERRMAVSFEMVTGCHGHHGQLPAAEYLVATAAHEHDESGGRPRFLAWAEFLSFCREQSLPVNDTWLFAGGQWASAARTLLDDLALSGGVTGVALQRLNALVQEGASAGCLHLVGTYPHDQWQGSRLEGFVVAQGQATDAATQQALQALRDATQRSALQLGDVPAVLRAPYADTLASAGGASEAVVPQVMAAQQGWLPHVALQPVSREVREAVVAAVMQEKAPILLVHPQPGGPPVVCRTHLAALQPPELLALLQQQVQPTGDAQLAARLVAQLQTVAAAPGPALDSVRASLPRALVGAPPLSSALRFKKKMMLWSAPSAQDGDAAMEDAGAGTTTSTSTTSATASGGYMGYCMMTFVIRNGLTALGLGLQTYLGYVSNLARSWGLSQRHAAQVDVFARAWAAWVSKHGGAGAVKSSTYLDSAEPFVADFLAGLASGKFGGQGGGRPKGAFQGILVLVDTPEASVGAFKRALAVEHLIDADNLPPFSKPLVAQGSILWLRPDCGAPKNMRALLDAAGNGRHVFCVVQAVARELLEDGSPAAKRVRGMQAGKVKQVEACMAGGAKSGPAYDAAQARTKTMYESTTLEEVVAWLGPGAPLPPADPAAICCFLSIPGSGKTAVTDSLGSLLAGGEVHGLSRVNLRSVNSDRLKATARGYQANRYWYAVAAAADTTEGGGSCTVVVADKNLVPSPPGNVQRVAGILKDSGALTLAVVPVCGGTTSAATHPELYTALPELPFPLEFVALCMLRVLQRKKHEGNLDGGMGSAASVVAMFACFFRNTSRATLVERLRSSFSAVAEVTIAVAADDQPDRAVPVEVLAHVAQGLASVQESASPCLPPEWEARARQLLTDPAHSARLLALQRPLDACKSDLNAALLAAIQQQVKLSQKGEAAGAGASGLDPAPSISTGLTGVHLADGVGASADGGVVLLAGASAGEAAGEAQLPVKWIAIAGFDDAPLREAVKAVLPAELHDKLKAETHVTLWHAADPVLGPDAGLRAGLLAAVGSEAVVEVGAVDYEPGGNAAAVVQVLAGTEHAAVKPYPHITLVIGEGREAKESNRLPELVAQGGAQRLALHEPVQLTGQVLAFVTD